ncbi:THUMP domain-containing class I SAM-dependent RNA methyltransferase [Pilibacter termitis]|uniref:THUMP domain-containing class I SAM-dependent RNA methyltransferase n=1 Tax=Pilibacter termitis TaxID=263852 RepID=UPI001186AE74|nr:class I SAM-dependent RNA methyltransferase [Pilibacter termitis]
MTKETKLKLVAACAAGMEALVGREIRNLGIECQVENGKVLFEGTIVDIARTNVWLRTADRIKIILGEFPATTFDGLFEGVKALAWEEFLPLDAEFPVAGKSIKSKLFSTPDVQSITKKAIVNKLREVYHRPASVPLAETGSKFPIEVALRNDIATLTIDTTGSSLFKRGYRTEKGGAPLKENMAAALMMLTNWYPDKPLVDFTCGSGTIPIEAALIARNIAPGLKRNFQFEEWGWFDKNVLAEVKAAARSEIKQDLTLDILATDIDHRLIEIAKENARLAGVAEDIEFKQMRLQDFHTEKEYGVLVSNPPYGERLGDFSAVKPLYREMGEVLIPLETWSKYILTSDLMFEEHFGAKATKKRKLYNGALRVDYYQYWGKRKPREQKIEKGTEV